VTLTLDHLVVGASTLDLGRAWARDELGADPIVGGRHVFMGTHNLVLRLDEPSGTERYLEILAIDPDARDPGRPRWFDLDDPGLRAALATAPRLIAWVARSDDLVVDRQRLVDAGHDPGPIHPAERDTPSGTLRWRITIPGDGRRLAGGAIPTLMAWDAPSPATSLPPSGVSLDGLVVRGVSGDVGVMLVEAGVIVAEGSEGAQAVLRTAGRGHAWSGSTIDTLDPQPTRTSTARLAAMPSAQASTASQSRKSPGGSTFHEDGIRRTTRSGRDLGGSLGS
jgi:hypothetical protein